MRILHVLYSPDEAFGDSFDYLMIEWPHDELTPTSIKWFDFGCDGVTVSEDKH